MGALVIRIFTGKQIPQGYSWEQVFSWMMKDINECIEYGKKHGVIVAIQNHDDFIKTADQAKKVIEAADSEWFGLVLDIGSYRTNDAYKEIESTDFAENFLDGFDNGPESVFAIQYSINDGTTLGRISTVTGLNYPHGAPQYGCCGFHQPSQNLANAFGTDANGLPKFNTFNEGEINFQTATVDPRVDHTIGIDGHPYKYNAALPFSNSWVRDAGVYGFFQSMKEQQLADCSCYKKEGPFIGTSKNIDIIRYADVLLMQAEAYIKLGQQALALPLINQVRERAAASTGRTKKADGTDPSNYLIKPYDGSNWTQEYFFLAQCHDYSKRVKLKKNA